MRADLKRLKRDSESSRAADSAALKPAAPIRSRRLLAVSAMVVIAAGAILIYLFNTGRTEAPSDRFPVNVTLTQLTTQPGPEYFPTLSPDGRSVAYAGNAQGNFDIYLLRVGGDNPINLTRDSDVADTQPAFSPDGNSIAFRSERQGGGIFVMATGESVRRITTEGFNPALAPNGNEIVYSTEPVDIQPRSRGRNSQLGVVNIQNGQRRNIGLSDGVQPQWSPHGDRIAYWTQVEGQRDL
ncbi:MAG: PD40 domain-containing protein [Acidobacteria bacterium]|nr:PD40 domain-containing protein [Acidobacteriota bacterium]